MDVPLRRRVDPEFHVGIPAGGESQRYRDVDIFRVLLYTVVRQPPLKYLCPGFGGHPERRGRFRRPQEEAARRRDLPDLEVVESDDGAARDADLLSRLPCNLDKVLAELVVRKSPPRRGR